MCLCKKRIFVLKKLFTNKSTLSIVLRFSSINTSRILFLNKIYVYASILWYCNFLFGASMFEGGGQSGDHPKNLWGGATLLDSWTWDLRDRVKLKKKLHQLLMGDTWNYVYSPFKVLVYWFRAMYVINIV